MHKLYYITYTPSHYIVKYFMNLREKDNLRRKDKSAVPKVSFIRRYHCTFKVSTIQVTMFDTILFTWHTCEEVFIITLQRETPECCTELW